MHLFFLRVWSVIFFSFIDRFKKKIDKFTTNFMESAWQGCHLANILAFQVNYLNCYNF